MVNKIVKGDPVYYYIASRYSRRSQMQFFARGIIHRGDKVTSRWVFGDHDDVADDKFNRISDDHRVEIGRKWATEDLIDLESAEKIICCTEDPDGRVNGRNRGGRHVELGVALGKGKKVIVCGPRENVFCCLPEIEWYPDFYTWYAINYGVGLPKHFVEGVE